MEPVAGRCAKLDEWALVPGIDLTLMQEGARCWLAVCGTQKNGYRLVG